MFRPINVRLFAAGAVAAGALAAAALAEDRPVFVLGGGSTFAAPIFAAWIDAYRSVAPTVDITYDVIGSGEGISRFLTGSLDFAATDAPLTAEQEDQVAGGVTHVPVTAGMVAVAYHLPDNIEGELRLPRDVLGDIFAGVITDWDDPRLQQANPDLALPDRSIYLVARSDGSGTTYAFTNHLNAISERWRRDGRGVGTAVGWPSTTMRARGNEGVAVTIERGEGTIGYVEYGIARQAGLPLAAVQNAAGAFIAPSPEAGAAAIASAELPDDLRIDLPDPAGPDAYPIVTFTWSLLRRTPSHPDKAEAIRAFTRWAISEGQEAAPGLGYVPLPPTVRERAALALTQAY